MRRRAREVAAPTPASLFSSRLFTEAETFDRCAAHPQQQGVYHYHSEPTSITNADASFAGVMRDGYPIYGRLDADGSLPADLDDAGGHTSATPDSTTPTYHYQRERADTDARS